MPYKVVHKKRKTQPDWLIKKKENGSWTVVGHSTSKKKAKASIRARHAGK